MKKFLSIFAIIGVLLSYPIYSYAVSASDLYEEAEMWVQTFVQVFGLIHSSHVEKHSAEELIDAAIRGMTEKLDKHSRYLNEEEFTDLRERSAGRYVGIGAEVSFENNMVKIERVFEGSGAEDAGLKANDLIYKVNNKNLKDIENVDLVKVIDRLKGAEGTTVTVDVMRGDEKHKFRITRRKITVSQAKGKLLEKNIAYIRLTQFSDTSARDLAKEYIRLHSPNIMKGPFIGLILDLRSNPGGRLDQAVRIADMFLDEGVIVSVKPRDENSKEVFRANIGQLTPSNLPIVILVNEFSASASEIVSGTLKDHHRATIVGIKTYGKGSVQSVIALPTGGALKLTTAKYYTASGKTPDHVGIEPDVKIKLPADYKPEKGKIDPQLKKAIEVLRNESEIQTLIEGNN